MKHFALVFYLLALSLPAAQARLEDPPVMAHPKYSAEVTLVSHGSRLPATFYGAAGPGPHPTILLLHGFPGFEKNLDIAQGMRDAGWNVLFFHYRGAWGADGEFSFTNAEEDVSAVTQAIRQQEFAEKYKIDANRIAYVGHSMGGHMAIAGLLANPQTRCSVAYDPANLGVAFSDNAAVSEQAWVSYSDSLFMLKGWSGSKLLEQVKEGNQLDLRTRAANIGKRAVLFVAADSEVIPLAHINELADALRNVEGSDVHYRLIKDDHSFNNHRQQLLAVTRDFLNQH